MQAIINPFMQLCVFGGPFHPEFAAAVVSQLESSRPTSPINIPLVGPVVEHRWFDSGAYLAKLPNVRDSDVILLDPLRLDGPDIWAMCVMADTARRASAKRIIAVLPYLEGRQDRKSEGRVTITAELALRLLEAAGVQRFLVLDPHVDQIQGMTTLPFDTLYASAIFLPVIEDLGLEAANVIVMGTDHGSVGRNSFYARYLNCPVGFVDKRRDPISGKARVFGVSGEVRGKVVVLIDDMISSCVSFDLAVQAILAEGADRIIGFATHPIFSDPPDGPPAVERTAGMRVERLFVSDTLKLPPQLPPNVQVVSSAGLLAQAIYRLHHGQSVSDLILKANHRPAVG